MLSVEYNFLFVFFHSILRLQSFLIIIILDHLSCAWMNLSGKVKFISSLLFTISYFEHHFKMWKTRRSLNFKSSVSDVSYGTNRTFLELQQHIKNHACFLQNSNNHFVLFVRINQLQLNSINLIGKIKALTATTTSTYNNLTIFFFMIFVLLCRKGETNKTENFHSQFSYVTNHSDHILIYIPIKLLMAAICNKFL